MVAADSIFIVTSGEYSDYGIEAVFSTREKADEYVERHGTDFRVEEFSIDSCVPDNSKKKWDIYLYYNTGDLCDCNLDDGVLFNRNYFRYVKSASFSAGFLNFNVTAETMSKAVKIASEMFMQVKTLESTKFPLLREKCVISSSSPDYPTYNYRNGTIVLHGNSRLANGYSSTTEEARYEGKDVK